ncbi:hypothetical protein C7S13_8480 [Burkholderia cepacia]|nr:hypothetical protein [Burkholderia cepacia]
MEKVVEKQNAIRSKYHRKTYLSYGDGVLKQKIRSVPAAVTTAQKSRRERK